MLPFINEVDLHTYIQSAILKVNDINDPLFQNAHLINSLDCTFVTSAPVLLRLTFMTYE